MPQFTVDQETGAVQEYRAPSLVAYGKHHRTPLTEPEPKRVFESGAIRSSKLPRYDLIPREVLNCLADRLKLGAAKYGEQNWKKGIDDAEFLKDTLNHMQGHLSNVMAADFSEDDEYGNIGGILFGCMVRLAALKAKKVTV